MNSAASRRTGLRQSCLSWILRHRSYFGGCADDARTRGGQRRPIEIRNCFPNVEETFLMANLCPVFAIEFAGITNVEKLIVLFR
jgi:hypothetical protein